MYYFKRGAISTCDHVDRFGGSFSEHFRKVLETRVQLTELAFASERFQAFLHCLDEAYSSVILSTMEESGKNGKTEESVGIEERAAETCDDKEPPSEIMMEPKVTRGQ